MEGRIAKGYLRLGFLDVREVGFATGFLPTRADVFLGARDGALAAGFVLARAGPRAAEDLEREPVAAACFDADR
jgi:hypothetical protein